MNTYLDDNNIEEYTKEYGAFLIFAILSFLFFIFTGVLLAYHTYLISTNQTTWEHSKSDTITYLRIYPKGFYPFN